MHLLNLVSLLFVSLLIGGSTPEKPTPAVQSTPVNPFVVVLDAGHGGHDPGNLGNGYLEKKIALNIVLQAGAILEKQPNIKVIYTRKDDTFVDLYKRGEIANKANANLFVSVHCDSHTSNAYGAGTFVMGLHVNQKNFEVAKKENSVIYLEDNYKERYAQYDINSPESLIGHTIMQEEFLEESIQVASEIQGQFTGQLKRKDRKVKQAGFIVLHQTFMPSVLVETGFLTNKAEGAYLNSKKGQQQMGRAIAQAVINYKKRLDKTAADNDLLASSEVSTPEPPGGNEPEKAQETIKKEETPKQEDKPSTQSTEPEPKVQSNTAAKSPVVYKVQLLATVKTIPLSPSYWNGLDTLSKEPYKNLYRYMYGSVSSYAQARKLQKEAASKGYSGCYVVVYKNGERVPLTSSIRSAYP
jgi:N-acetylmuramoyl-L-alanine amidase